jgi:hypothetical protein
MTRGSARLLVPVAVCAALSAGLLSACGDDDEPDVTPTPVVTVTPTPAPTAVSTPDATSEPTASAEPTSSAEPTAGAAALTDGRYPAHLTAVNVSDRTITFDVVQFLTGDDATKAAQEDGAEAPPPNDYYIRNTNPALRTLPIPMDSVITVNTLEAETSGDSSKDVTVTLEQLAGYANLADYTFWITVKDGVIGALAEQFLP